MQSFAESTQARFWTFPSEQLAALREAVRKRAQEKLAAALAAEGGSGSDASGSQLAVLTVEEEALLRNYYENKLQQLCRENNQRDSTRFTKRAAATAQMYFKRFYLKVSVVEEHPKEIMLACLYLAGKVEEEKIEMDDLLPHAPKLKPEHLIALEQRLLETMRFQLVIRSPYRSLIGFLQDLQAWSLERNRDAEGQGLVQALQLLQERATEHVGRALISEVVFLAPPQQIALAALRLAARAEGERCQATDVATWLQQRFTFLDQGGSQGGASPTDNAQGLLRQIASIEEQIVAVTNPDDDPEQATRRRLQEVETRRVAVCKVVRAYAIQRERLRLEAAQKESHARKQSKIEQSEQHSRELTGVMAALAPSQQQSEDGSFSIKRRRRGEAGSDASNPTAPLTSH